MYESFYGLKEKPFSMLPDPGFLYLSKKHQKALTLFEYGLMNHAGFSVISGEIGSGKTTLLRKLLQNMSRNVTVGMITNTHKQFGELLDWVLSAFDIHERGLNEVEKHQRFVDFLVEQYARKKTTLLIVDEAQNMAADKLEELRMLSNINSEKDQVLQIILAGQPELKETLGLPELRQFVQRIAVDYHLGSLDLEDTRGYINHRLTVAGAKAPIFTDDACDMLHKYSGGTPRLINLLCDTAMVYGFADEQQVIEEDLVAEMITERMQNSLVPLACIELPKKKTRNDLSKAATVAPPILVADEDEHDLGEKILRVAQHENSPETNKDELLDIPAEPVVPAEKVETPDIAEPKQEAVVPEPEEVESDTTVSVQPVAPASLFLKPLLIGLSVLALATLFFALSLKDEVDQSPSAAIENNPYKSEPELIVRDVSPALQAEDQVPDSPAMPDAVIKQLDETQKAQQELLQRQQQAEERMKALEEQAALMQQERDAALAKAKAEKEKRDTEARAARIAAQREKEAQEMAQKAINEAMAAERKARLLEELRSKEKQEADARAKAELEAAAALQAQQESIKVVAEPAVTETKEAEKKVEKQPADIRCEGATARFLSTCR